MSPVMLKCCAANSTGHFLFLFLFYIPHNAQIISHQHYSTSFGVLNHISHNVLHSYLRNVEYADIWGRAIAG